ncbi:MAG: hypothetical protein BAJALOKI1v1_2110002 [Promethearchaeota archaeon]|nr:MAG: hypothetical protein BAJALOKI1v1_2110002 [Candidatus Lokiarchaeota archaeon]
MKLISVNLPESYLEVLELLVSEGKFPNRSEAIRMGIRDLIKTEYLIEEKIKKKYEEKIEQNLETQKKVEEQLIS